MLLLLLLVPFSSPANRSFSSLSILCDGITAIDGVGFTTPVGVVVVVISNNF